MKRTTALTAAFALALGIASAQAATYTTKEVNSGPQGVDSFDPGFIKMAPGDTLHVISSDLGHNMETIDGMIPAGAQAVRVPMGKPADIKLTTPGVYVFRCVPHYGMGMVLVVQVGAATNLAQVEGAAAKAPPLARKRLQQDLALVR